LTRKLDAVPDGPQVVLKLTIPDVPDFYSALTNHAGCRRTPQLGDEDEVTAPSLRSVKRLVGLEFMSYRSLIRSTRRFDRWSCTRTSG
jgi:hypothetical protein